MRYILAFLLLISVADAKQYVFRIKTKSGSKVGNIHFTGRNFTEAEAKLMKRYKGCTVLSMDEK